MFSFITKTFIKCKSRFTSINTFQYLIRTTDTIVYTLGVLIFAGIYFRESKKIVFRGY